MTWFSTFTLKKVYFDSDKCSLALNNEFRGWWKKVFILVDVGVNFLFKCAFSILQIINLKGQDSC